MNTMKVVVFLAIGAVAGWLGGYLFKILVFAAGGFIGSMEIAGVGALALLYLINLYDRTRRPSAIR